MQADAHRQISLHEFSSLRSYRAKLLAACSDRTGGVSKAPYEELNVGLHVGDDPLAVLENRRRVAHAVGMELTSFVVAQQVHGGEVRLVTAAEGGRGALHSDDALPGADALITREHGIVLAVMLADCVPVIVFDPLTPAVGIAHAGWAGTVQHVARNTVHAMRREFGGDPSTFLAVIGPSIGPDSYEVGSEVAEQLLAQFPDTDVVRPHGTEKFLLDLWGCNVADLLDAGLPRKSIEVTELDTFQLPERFFSHRRQQPTGRFLAFAMLRSSSGIVNGRG
jgi:purine-nucleoside/S-methyl-5'-thioadenosine phosphorylase / adenosine deaminase